METELSSGKKPMLKFFYKRPLIIVLFMAVVILFVAGAFWFTVITQRLKSPPLKIEEINFPSLVWKERMTRNIEAASQERDEGKRFDIYRRIFNDLLSIYIRDHDSATRSQLEVLTQFMAQQFPDRYLPARFPIPCLDLDCGTPDYPAEITSIQDRLRDAENFDPDVADSVFKKFEAAALSSDVNFQWQNYLGAFQEIKTEWERTGSESIKQAAAALKEFLTTNYSDQYTPLERLEPDIFAI